MAVTAAQVRSSTFREIVYAHIIASYVAGTFSAVVATGFHFLDFLSLAFSIFMSPTLAMSPLLLLLDRPIPALCAIAIYFITLVGTYRYLCRRQEKFLAGVIVAANETPPTPVGPLPYFGPDTPAALPHEKHAWTGWTSLASALAMILTLIIVAYRSSYVTNSGAHATNVSPNLILCIVGGLSSLAIITAMIALFRIKPGSNARGAALAGICIALLVGGLIMGFALMQAFGLDAG